MLIQAHITVKQGRCAVYALFGALVLDRDNIAVAVGLNERAQNLPQIYSEKRHSAGFDRFRHQSGLCGFRLYPDGDRILMAGHRLADVPLHHDARL